MSATNPINKEEVKCPKCGRKKQVVPRPDLGDYFFDCRWCNEPFHLHDNKDKK